METGLSDTASKYSLIPMNRCNSGCRWEVARKHLVWHPHDPGECNL